MTRLPRLPRLPRTTNPAALDRAYDNLHDALGMAVTLHPVDMLWTPRVQDSAALHGWMTKYIELRGVDA